MSNVIDFLERMGQDAKLRHATRATMDEELLKSGISPAARQAIVDGDEHGLTALLGAKSNVCAMIFPVQEDEETQQPRDVNVQIDQGVSSKAI